MFQLFSNIFKNIEVNVFSEHCLKITSLKLGNIASLKTSQSEHCPPLTMVHPGVSACGIIYSASASELDISGRFTFYYICCFITVDISLHLIFYDIWLFKTFDISWHLTFHDISNLINLIHDISWHLTFHDIWYFMTFDIL